MLEECCRNNWVALNGCASCVAGETKILNPITGIETPIEDLYKSNTAPIVMTLNGPAQATVPFVKGFEELYEVTLSNGRKFKATAEHLVLTQRGFSSVASLSCGEQLCGYEQFRPQTIFGH